MIAFEAAKLWRSRRPVIGALAVAGFLALMLLGFWLYAHKQTGGQVEFRYTFENESYFNGLTFTVYAFYFGSVLLLPVFVAVEGAAAIAGEAGSGTLRLLLTRPVARGRVLLTKAAVAGAFAAALCALLLGTSLLVGLLAVGWGDLTLYPGVLQMTDVYQHLSQREALLRFLLVWPSATWALLAPVTLSLLLSTWTRSAVNAAGAAVAVYLALHVISSVPFFDELRPYLFTSQVGAWRELLQERIDWHRVGVEHARLGASTALFLLLAHLRFRRREER